MDVDGSGKVEKEGWSRVPFLDQQLVQRWTSTRSFGEIEC